MRAARVQVCRVRCDPKRLLAQSIKIHNHCRNLHNTRLRQFTHEPWGLGRDVSKASFLVVYYGFKFTVFPVAADCRAASRISVTITLVSSEDNPSGFTPSTTTARRYVSESSYGTATFCAAIFRSSFSPARRTFKSSRPTVITYPVLP